MTTVEIRARILTSTTHSTILVQQQKESTSNPTVHIIMIILAINGNTQPSIVGQFGVLNVSIVILWDIWHGNLTMATVDIMHMRGP